MEDKLQLLTADLVMLINRDISFVGSVLCTEWHVVPFHHLHLVFLAEGVPVPGACWAPFRALWCFR